MKEIKERATTTSVLRNNPWALQGYLVHAKRARYNCEVFMGILEHGFVSFFLYYTQTKNPQKQKKTQKGVNKYKQTRKKVL